MDERTSLKKGEGESSELTDKVVSINNREPAASRHELVLIESYNLPGQQNKRAFRQLTDTLSSKYKDQHRINVIAEISQ